MNSIRDLRRYPVEELKQAYLERLQIAEISTDRLESELARRKKQIESIRGGVLFDRNQVLADRIRGFLVFTANHFSVTVADLISTARNQRLADARHVGMFVAMNVYRISQKDVTRLFGRRDHSSAIHARKVVTNRPELSEEAKVLQSKWINYNKK
tara:strand:+ start:703 stop:1167 length:465 start_codon:yes stop_codon:yes gene_type:complete